MDAESSIVEDSVVEVDVVVPSTRESRWRYLKLPTGKILLWERLQR